LDVLLALLWLADGVIAAWWVRFARRQWPDHRAAVFALAGVVGCIVAAVIQTIALS
jgi:hypothetical protein